MEEIYGEVPNGPVVFAACDANYFKDHAPSLIYSCDDVNKDMHIHVCNPTQETFNIANIINTDTKINLTFSYNDIPNSGREMRAYYASLRFFVLPVILPHAKKVLTVDVDCLLMKDFDWPETATGYFPREPLETGSSWEREGTRVAAGVVYMDERAINVANAVAMRIKEGPMQWFIDQIALSEVFRQVEPEHVTNFDNQFMDWEFIEGTTIWTGKGPRKYDNPKYVEAKNFYNRLIGSTARQWQ
jgi:hypothetical protein